ncbi:hypothetical protein OG866_26940 [Streptomyces sp. NBC_00663]|uniref:hypothetical protein n=1 Tax=Streptomyces sp. NBC_00663 TaxID=2975801 RepID=UPI002E30B30F|nr:hypothetical protein [Streptomyces sp. NBC_00663]
MIRPEWQEHIRRMVDGWPPVTPETYAQLALLLAPERPASPSAALPTPSARPAQHLAA